MDCKKSFEKDPETQSDLPPTVDVEVPQDPPPFQSYPSYPAQSYVSPSRRSGMYVPTPLFVLFILLFLFESSVLFVYTVVALYNTLPASLVPVQSPRYDCQSGNNHAPINVAPNIWLPAAAVTTIVQTTQHEMTITVTVTPTSHATSSEETTSRSPSSAIAPVSTTSPGAEATDAAIAALVSAMTHQESSGPVTVTAPVPTTTVLSTASEVLPSITTMTVLSTAAAVQSTVTAVTTIAA